MSRSVAFVLAAIGAAGIAVPVASPAAPPATTVHIAAFQFVGGGRITLNPFDGVTPGSPAVPAGGTMLGPQSAERGAGVIFQNHDVEKHHVVEAVAEGVTPRFSVEVGAGATGGFTVGTTWSGTVTYVCTIHRGMIGSFSVR